MCQIVLFSKFGSRGLLQFFLLWTIWTKIHGFKMHPTLKRSQTELSQSHSQQLSGQIGTFFFNKDSIFSSWLPIHEQLFPRSSKKICKKISIVSLTKYDQENMILFPLVLEYRDRRNVKKHHFLPPFYLSLCLSLSLSSQDDNQCHI